MESNFSTINQYVHFAFHVLNDLFWPKHKLYVISIYSAFSLFLLSFYWGIFSPIIFNFFIVPYIERKLGHKIGHPAIDEYIWLGKWMNTQTWTSLYIMNRYYAWKFMKDRGLPTARYFRNFPLKLAGYTIDQMSKKEIFFSAMIISVVFVMLVLCVFLGIVMVFFKSYLTLPTIIR